MFVVWHNVGRLGCSERKLHFCRSTCSDGVHQLRYFGITHASNAFGSVEPQASLLKFAVIGLVNDLPIVFTFFMVCNNH